MRRLHTVQPGTPLTGALGLLLEAGVSVLPVVDNVCASAACTCCLPQLQLTGLSAMLPCPTETLQVLGPKW